MPRLRTIAWSDASATTKVQCGTQTDPPPMHDKAVQVQPRTYSWRPRSPANSSIDTDDEERTKTNDALYGIDFIGCATPDDRDGAQPATGVNHQWTGAAADPADNRDNDMEGPYLVRMQRPIPWNSRFSDTALRQ